MHTYSRHVIVQPDLNQIKHVYFRQLYSFGSLEITHLTVITI